MLPHNSEEPAFRPIVLASRPLNSEVVPEVALLAVAGNIGIRFYRAVSEVTDPACRVRRFVPPRVRRLAYVTGRPPVSARLELGFGDDLHGRPHLAVPEDGSWTARRPVGGSAATGPPPKAAMRRLRGCGSPAGSDEESS